MSFFRNLADNLADKVKRVAGVVPPYEVVETSTQQFARFIAPFSNFVDLFIFVFLCLLDKIRVLTYLEHIATLSIAISVLTIYVVFCQHAISQKIYIHGGQAKVKLTL